MNRDFGGEPVDRPVAVRLGEELDVERLGPYLEDALGVEGEIGVRQYPSGYSNLTYLVRIGDAEFVLRRPPFGSKPKSGHDMQREHAVLSALHESFPYCPEPLLYCDDPSVIGSPFYVMQRLEGIIVRRDFPPELSLSPADVRSLFEHLIDVHVALHSVDYREVGLEDFGKPEGYVERQVQGWSKRFRRARTPDVPDFEGVMAWLEASRPPDTGGGCIIHNDFRLDNVVLDARDPLKIIGVLDWEMATLGDPLMDLGASLAYWVDRTDPPEFQALHMMPTIVEGAPTRAEVVARYAERSGLAIDEFNFYYCFGLFRLAVIVQQIYYRSYHGQTDDPRFRGLNRWVGALAGAAGRLI
jgi:aminoglycoside phosphotransferase (APT) family kinase protein